MKKVLTVLTIVIISMVANQSQAYDPYSLESRLADLEQRVYQLEELLRYSGNNYPRGRRSEWVCKIKTTFKTYVEVGKTRAQAERKVYEACGHGTVSMKCKNAVCEQ